jgi:hypothetical protein
MAGQQNPFDLGKLFQSVTGTLKQNQDSLNEADDINHDHGDNMVDTFQVITQAMKEKKGADPADQLAYASEILRQKKSGSAQLYAGGLSQASQDFRGKQIDSNNAISFIQTLMGGGQQAQPQQQSQSDGIGDLLGNLLGGGQQSQPQQQSQGGGIGDLLGNLLGSSGAQQPQTQQSSGFDLGNLLQAGMAYMNTKSRGGGDLEAIVNALVSGSASSSGYRQQSGSLVANTLMQVIKGMVNK